MTSLVVKVVDGPKSNSSVVLSFLEKLRCVVFNGSFGVSQILPQRVGQ